MDAPLKTSPSAAAPQEAPQWIGTIRRKYLSGDASVFVLYRNIYDKIALGNELVDLQQCLLRELLAGKKEQVLAYNPSGTEQVVALQGPNPETDLPPLDQLEQALTSGRKTAAIIHYADSVFPAGDTALLSMADRQAVVQVHRWSLNPTIGANDAVVFLLVESLADLNPKILSNPRVATIEIPMPGQADREFVIRMTDPTLSKEQIARLANQASGLRLVQIMGLFGQSGTDGRHGEEERERFILDLIQGSADALQRAKKLAQLTRGQSFDEIRRLLAPGSKNPEGDLEDELVQLMRARKRELVTQECFGLIEFVESALHLDDLGGMEEARSELKEIAEAMRSDDRSRAPMGVLVVGAMGAGKTFLIKAFCASAGIPAVMLKNFRSKWVGATEGNLEKVLAMVKAMGPIGVIIDEGDRSLGGGDEDDGGTSSRCIARLKEFMSDPDNRGRVLVVLMTNRPDKLDTDLKRPGRLDEKIPLFYPQSSAERANVVRAVLRRYTNGTNAIEGPDLWLEDVLETCVDYSNAELESIALLALKVARRHGQRLTRQAFDEATKDFLRTGDQRMVEYMELLAVSEASRRSLLPPKFQAMPAEEISQRMNDLRVLLRL
ncbi:MAG TPA: ATP-binding protein [Burkholderiaceae bacterium]